MTDDLPPAPVNVKVQLRDGTTVATECIYLGVDDEGIHQWQTLEIFPVTQVAGFTMDKLPGRCSVNLRCHT